VLEKDTFAELFSRLHGRGQWAAFVTQVASFCLGMVEDVIEAEAAHDIGGSVAGKPLRRGVPVKDATLRVHEVDAVIEFVKHLLEEPIENGSVIGTRVVISAVLAIDSEPRECGTRVHYSTDQKGQFLRTLLRFASEHVWGGNPDHSRFDPGCCQ